MQHWCLFGSPDNERKSAREDGSVQWSQLKVAYFSYNTILKFVNSVVSGVSSGVFGLEAVA